MRIDCVLFYSSTPTTFLLLGSDLSLGFQETSDQRDWRCEVVVSTGAGQTLFTLRKKDYTSA
eukprot:scaffold1400_cov137-Cylindrotheca_fusiformis.AAC.5